ncbi:hypothetical protein ACG2LH_06935 [Zhouia sp. PK063]|uniref:hypothetical protein n=1 Tax=Zhouia sp. PK063 TaxID=3373602 RepID=UPI0037B0627E
MIKSIFYVISIFCVTFSYAQVGIGTTVPDDSAVLDVTSTDKGVLLPRVALTSNIDEETIPNPTKSLLVYNTATVTNQGAEHNITRGFYYWNGTEWDKFSSANAPTNKYFAEIYKTTVQNVLSDGNATKVNFGASVYTSGVNFDDSSLKNGFIAPLGGYYRISYTIGVQTKNGNELFAEFYATEDGTKEITSTTFLTLANNDSKFSASKNTIVYLNENSKVYIYCNVTSTKDNNSITLLTDGTNFNIELIKAD